jgi:hypothetical protein
MNKFFGILLLFVISSCTKEVARKHYLLKLHFNNGMEHESDGVIYEKDKTYKSKSVEDIGDHVAMKYYPECIWFSDYDQIDMKLFKTKEDKLVGTTTQTILVSNASNVIGIESEKLFGSLELEGAYKSPFRKITVDNGTFSFTWSNAEDFGMQDTVLTGTWSLKRK